MTTQLFTINGMHCEACTKLSAKRIKTIDGVSDAVVTLASKTASVSSSRLLTAHEVNAVLSDTDYRVEEQS